MKVIFKKNFLNLMKFFKLLFSDNRELLNKYLKGKLWVENENRNEISYFK